MPLNVESELRGESMEQHGIQVFCVKCPVNHETAKNPLKCTTLFFVFTKITSIVSISIFSASHLSSEPPAGYVIGNGKF